MKKAIYSIIATITTVFLLLSMLGGCDNQKKDTDTVESAGSVEPEGRTVNALKM